jgi:hypothetical protein
MSLLRAQVRIKKGWWEICLLDLDIRADGESEDAMLRQVEHALIAEYHLAKTFGETPFVKFVKAVPVEVQKAWENGGTKLRALNLPEEVSLALSMIFRQPKLTEFSVDVAANNNYAKAA